jgi:hypothetical protein
MLIVATVYHVVNVTVFTLVQLAACNIQTMFCFYLAADTSRVLWQAQTTELPSVAMIT